MWIPVVTLAILAAVGLVVVGPFLKMFGFVDWQWKTIFAPLWLPLTAMLLWLLGWALYWGALIGLLAFLFK
jgi:hypothetical protein